MRPFVRRTSITLAVMALLAAGVWFLRPSPIPVDVAVVTRGALSVTLDQEGQTRIHPRYVVAAPVAGRLLEISLDEGDAVSCGAVVARLAPTPLDARSREQARARLAAAQAAQREAAAAVAEATAAFEQAGRSLARKEPLARAGVLAAEELDLARTEQRTREEARRGAEQRAEVARCEADAARSALLDAERGAVVMLRAPADGLVLRLFEESERTLAAGQPLLEIGDPTRLEVVAEVLTTDAVSIRPGMPMRIDAGGTVRWPGHVERIDPAAYTKISPLGVEEQRVEVVGKLDEAVSQLDARLGDRFRIRAEIVLWQGENVLQVPSGAVFRSGDGWSVYRVENGRARLQPVELGHRGAHEVEIASGLDENTPVVLYPPDRISDGARIDATSQKE